MGTLDLVIIQLMLHRNPDINKYRSIQGNHEHLAACPRAATKAEIFFCQDLRTKYLITQEYLSHLPGIARSTRIIGQKFANIIRLDDLPVGGDTFRHLNYNVGAYIKTKLFFKYEHLLSKRKIRYHILSAGSRLRSIT